VAIETTFNHHNFVVTKGDFFFKLGGDQIFSGKNFKILIIKSTVEI
jgi:hypothetical protein